MATIKDRTLEEESVDVLVLLWAYEKERGVGGRWSRGTAIRLASIRTRSKCGAQEEGLSEETAGCKRRGGR